MGIRDRCPNCGYPRLDAASFCSQCGEPYEEPKSDSASQGLQSDHQNTGSAPWPEKKYVAWEDKENLGFFAAMLRTWKESVFYPNRFYSSLPYSGGLASPLLYAVIIGWVGMAIGQIFSFLFSTTVGGIIARYIDEPEPTLGIGMEAAFTFLFILVAPILLIIIQFMAAGIYHLIFMIFGWAKRDFEATFRALAYAEGPMIFLIVPICGDLAGAIWSIVLGIIGFKHMQKTTGGRAALVYFLPIIICCCLGILLVAIFGVALTGFLQEVMDSGYYY